MRCAESSRESGDGFRKLSSPTRHLSVGRGEGACLSVHHQRWHPHLHPLFRKLGRGSRLGVLSHPSSPGGRGEGEGTGCSSVRGTVVGAERGWEAPTGQHIAPSPQPSSTLRRCVGEGGQEISAASRCGGAAMRTWLSCPTSTPFFIVLRRPPGHGHSRAEQMRGEGSFQGFHQHHATETEAFLPGGSPWHTALAPRAWILRAGSVNGPTSLTAVRGTRGSGRSRRSAATCRAAATAGRCRHRSLPDRWCPCPRWWCAPRR